jgi:hypothetical protein
MTPALDRPPCPFCGAPRCIRKREGTLGKTCGKRSCRGKAVVEQLGPARLSIMRQRGAKGRPAKAPLLTADHKRGYNAGWIAGKRKGFKDGYAAAKSELPSVSRTAPAPNRDAVEAEA